MLIHSLGTKYHFCTQSAPLSTSPFFYLICEAIGTAATPGLLCQLRVIVNKIIVEKQMECRLAGETEVLGEKLPTATFVHHKIPRDQTRV
jgi:hypothetical protein